MYNTMEGFFLYCILIC